MDRAASTDKLFAAVLFVLTLVSYAYFFGGGGWNQNSHYDLTRALVERGSIAIGEYSGNTGDIVIRNSRVYSNKAPGVSMLAAAPYLLAKHIGEIRGIPENTLRAYVCTVVISGLFTAAIAPLLFLFGRRALGASIFSSAAIALVIAWATPLLPYSTMLYLHAANGALMLASFVCARLGAQTQRPERWILLAGSLAGLAALTNYLSIPVVAILAAYAGFQRRRIRDASVFVAGALPFLFLFGWYQISAFGGLFQIPTSMNPAFVTRGALFGVLNMPTLEALHGITISPYRGLFFLSPVLLLSVAGAIVLIRRREWLELLVISSIVSVFFAFNLTINNWEGGFNIGPRWIVPVVPFLGILMLRARTGLHALWLALAVISFLNCFAATAVDPQPSGSIAHPLGDYIFPLLITGRFSEELPVHPLWSPQYVHGHVSVSRHTVDEIVPFTKYRPGSAASEWASFNLGEFVFGPGRILSLLPVILWIVGGSTILLTMARRKDREANIAATTLS